MKIEFWVPGKSEPAGSKVGFPIKSKKSSKTFVNIVDSNIANIKKWRPVVQHYCQIAMKGNPPLKGPIKLVAHFYMLRPKSHFTSKGKLTKTARPYPTVTPDTTKLIRSLEDALNKLAWEDDSQVVKQAATKSYSEHEGVLVKIIPLIKPQGVISWE